MEMFDCCCRCDHGYESSGDECEDDDAVGLSHVGEAAYECLRSRHNREHHKLWNVTSGTFEELHPTPADGWTRTSEYPCEHHDEWFPDRMSTLMKKTTVWCDVMSLGPPDGLFMEKFKEALAVVAETSKTASRPIVVRMMFGNIVGMPVNCNKVMKKLTEDLPSDDGEVKLHMWVGAWRRGTSWNHAKIIAVDGFYLHTGGHNLWDAHYLKQKPVHDLSCQVQGRVAHDGHLFANEQWDFIEYKQDTFCGQFVDKLPDGVPLVAKTRVTITEWPISVAAEFPPRYRKSRVPKQDKPDGEVTILSVGRYGALLRHQRPSDDAFCAMLASSKKVIRMGLQDLGPVCIPGTKRPLPGCVWPSTYLDILATALYERGVDVEMVLSNPGSIPGGLGATEACYGNGWTCVDVAAEIIKAIQKQYPEAEDAKLRQIVAENLRICYIRQARGPKYDDGNTVGMHAKHFIIDDVCCYIGSQNLYVCDLAEWGLVIDSAEQTAKIMDGYWHPMWKASYIGEDCDVQSVMDGLEIDRSGDATTPLSEQAAAQGVAHGNKNSDMYDATEADDSE